MILYSLGLIILGTMNFLMEIIAIPFVVLFGLPETVTELPFGVDYFLETAVQYANSFGYYNPPFEVFMDWFRVVVAVTFAFYSYKLIRFVIRMVRGA